MKYGRHLDCNPFSRIKSKRLPLEAPNMLSTILMVFAFVLLALAAFWNPSPPRVSLGWLGMAFWALAVLLAGHTLVR